MSLLDFPGLESPNPGQLIGLGNFPDSYSNQRGVLCRYGFLLVESSRLRQGVLRFFSIESGDSIGKGLIDRQHRALGPRRVELRV